MTIVSDFAYLAPTSLEEALVHLAAGNGQVAVLAGGTDLVPWMRDDRVSPETVVALRRVPGLARLDVDGGALHIGCLTTFSALLASDAVRQHLPLLVEMAGTVASVGIRNQATLVGNICAAVPCCDAGPGLLALGAEVHVASTAGTRAVPIERWFEGPRRTALRSGELVTHVAVPLPAPDHGAAYARLSRTRGEDLAQASVAVVVEPGHRYRVAFGAVAPTPVRATRIEARLAGHALDAGLVDEVVAMVGEEIRPISDVRASAHYRLRMSEVMLRRALAAATARAAGEGPAYGTSLL
jgi:CO/xanthine dehydrogenase FAD-binding subunit